MFGRRMSGFEDRLVASMPVVLRDRRDECARILQKAAIALKKSVEQTSKSVLLGGGEGGAEDAEQRLAVARQCEAAMGHLKGVLASRLECSADFQALSDAVRARDLPGASEDFGALLVRLRAKRPAAARDFSSAKVLGGSGDACVLIFKDAQGFVQAAKTAAAELNDDHVGEEYNVEKMAEKLRCPFMRTLMVEPMRNLLCNHRYSKRGVDAMFKGDKGDKASVECCVAGCGKKFTRADLAVDEETAQDVEAFKERRAQGAEAHGAGAGAGAGSRKRNAGSDEER